MTKAKTLATLVSNNNPLADGSISVGDVTGLQTQLDAKQAALVSGTSIKTVNGTSILGSGNIQIDGGVVSFNTRTGAVTLSSSDVTAALGYTPATSGDISSAISALVDTAPATLDTLNELAAALGDDPNFATTVTNLVAAKQDTLVSGTNIKTVNGTSILGSGNIQIDGGVTSFNTRTGAVTLSSSDVTTALGYTPYNSTNPSGYITSSASITGNAATATALQTARTINGVSFDGTANITVADSTKLPLSGGTMTGAITFAASQTWPTFNQNTTGNAATSTKINSQGNYANSDPGTTRGPAGLNFYTVYSNGYPTTFGNLIHVNGGGGGQLLIGWSGTDGAHAPNYIRSKRDNDSGAWSPWALLLTDVNYNSYSPTLTGGGASGTWGINITGNAGTITSQANSATITASTGVNANQIVLRDGNGYIYANHVNFNTSESENPTISSFITSNGDGWSRKSSLAHVKNQIRGVADGTWGINVTGSAGSVAWGNVSSKPSNIMYYQGFTLDANTMDPNSTGFTYSVNAPYTGPVARFSTGGGYDLWLNAPYGGGNELVFRTRNGDNGSLNPWKYILHSGNYTNYITPLTGLTSADTARLGVGASGIGTVIGVSAQNAGGDDNIVIGNSTNATAQALKGSILIGSVASNTSAVITLPQLCIGYAGYVTSSGATCIGNYANVYGERAVALGVNVTAYGNSSIAIGSGDNFFVTTAAWHDNSIVIGASATSSAANQITLGNSSITQLRCQVTTITSLSDARDKIVNGPLRAGLDFVNRLKPVDFTWNTRDGAKVGLHDTGFLAQDLKQAQVETGVTIPELVSEIDPDRLEAGYGKLIPVYAVAIQELTALVAELRAEVNQLKQKVAI